MHTHTVEYYSALIKRKILTQAIAQMNLEKIKLSEISHLQRANLLFMDTGCRMVGARSGQERGDVV